MNDDDRALIEAVRRGNAEAFAALVCKYQAPLVAAAYQITCHAEDARDLAQEALLEAYRRLGQLRDPEKFRPWLFTILRHKCLRYLRQHRRKEISLEVCPEIPAREQVPADEELAELLTRLSLADREVLAARYLYELDYDEMAQALGINVRAVYTRCQRAKERLRVLLQADEEETTRTLRRVTNALTIGLTGDVFVQQVVQKVAPGTFPLPHQPGLPKPPSGLLHSASTWLPAIGGKIAAIALIACILGGSASTPHAPISTAVATAAIAHAYAPASPPALAVPLSSPSPSPLPVSESVSESAPAPAPVPSPAPVLLADAGKPKESAVHQAAKRPQHLYTLTGSVVAVGGSSVPHASVFCCCYWGKEHWGKDRPVWCNTTTDPHGAFHLAQPMLDPAGPNHSLVMACAPGLGVAYANVTDAEAPVKLTLGSVCTLKVCLHTSDGKPVIHERLFMSALRCDDNDAEELPAQLCGRFTAVSDRQGECEITGLPLGDIITVSLADERYVLAGREISLTNAPLTIARPLVLYRPATLRGRLVTKEHAQPVAGIRIHAVMSRFEVEVQEDKDASGHLRGTYHSSWGPRALAEGAASTGADGQYTITGLPPGKYSIRQDEYHEQQPDPGWVIISSATVTLKEGGTTGANDLFASHGALITGNITAEDDGAVIPDALVLIQGDARGPCWLHSGADGAFRLRVTPGEHYLNIDQPPAGFILGIDQPPAGFYAQRIQQRITPGEGETVNMDFKFVRGPVASPTHGYVLGPDLNPIAGATVTAEALTDGVSLKDAMTTTNADGEFFFTDKTPVALRARFGALATVQRVKAPFGGEKILQLKDNILATLTGMVHDEQGHPLPEVVVALDMGTSILTDAQGRYSFTGLYPDQPITVFAYLPGYNSVPGYGRPYKATLPAQTPTNITLSRLNLTGSITGQVVDQHGKPLTGVHADRSPTMQTPEQLLTVDGQGRFHCAAALGDTVHLCAFGDGMEKYAAQQVTVQEQTNVKLTVTMAEE